MLNEFRAFIMRGNVMDLAVAVVIGGAFGRIVTSFVDDLLMPVLGILLGGISFSDLKYVIRVAQGEAAELVINYGLFIQAVIDFLIIALAIFLLIKFINRMQKAKEEKPEAPPEPSKEELLLEEIRDILKAK